MASDGTWTIQLHSDKQIKAVGPVISDEDTVNISMSEVVGLDKITQNTVCSPISLIEIQKELSV